MASRYLDNHIAGDHIHTDKTCKIEEQQQKYHLGTLSNRLIGAGGG